MTKQIQAEKSVDSLLALHREYYDALDYIHLAALWHRLGTIDRSQRLRRNPTLLDALREHTLAMMPQIGVRELSNISLAMARAGLSRKPPWPELWNALGAEAQGRVGEFNAHDFGNTVWAFATAGHKAPALFEAIAQEAQGRVGEFNEQALSNTAWAFAKAGHKAPTLFEAIAQEVQGRVGEFKPQELANTAWAFAAADARCDALFEGPHFMQACERNSKGLLGNQSALTQLEVWRQWRDACSADGRTWPTLPAPLLAACQAAEGARRSRRSG